MCDFDFIEIGTSDFDTLVQECSHNSVGLAIEPIGYYLDRLPSKPLVRKIQVAVAFDDIQRTSVVYYVHPDDIALHGLPDWLRGCNRIDAYHPQHVSLGIEHLVRKEEVQQLPIGSILNFYGVRGIKVLKTDTEGADCQILTSFFRHLKVSGKGIEHFPERIVFENNSLTNPDELRDLLKLAKTFGYARGAQSGDELTLVLMADTITAQND